ncbi:hypothetical protein ABIE89_006952 [Bradyrhizobium niftali]|uniref:hypothetical protein n=1 Tax=Bradyrhizobium niftali TaxID=2560055 RepID=UPI00383541D2
MTSPTFIAEFADGVTTRMTCHCTADDLDLARGIKLSRAAYDSRIGQAPPPIVTARFVQPFSDETIRCYDSIELEAERSGCCQRAAPAADVTKLRLSEALTCVGNARRLRRAENFEEDRFDEEDDIVAELDAAEDILTDLGVFVSAAS